MSEIIATIAIIMGIAAYFNAEKLRKRLNLMEKVLIKNKLVDGNDLVVAINEVKEEHERKRANMSEEEKRAEFDKLVKKTKKLNRK